MEIITACAATQASINSMRETHRKGLRRRTRGNKTGSDGLLEEVKRQQERDEKTELGRERRQCRERFMNCNRRTDNHTLTVNTGLHDRLTACACVCVRVFSGQ